MPRIFRARPAPPVGRSVNIGVTMYPVAPRPSAAAPLATVAPVDSAPGFGDGPNGIFISDDGVYTIYAVDFYGTPAGVINTFTAEDDGTNAIPVVVAYTLATNCCAIIAIESQLSIVYVNITCLFGGETEYTALNVPLVP